jgi:hypothetical protein
MPEKAPKGAFFICYTLPLGKTAFLKRMDSLQSTHN